MKTEVREYFNKEGFNRWNKIYSDSDEVNGVQLDIRTGHDQTIQKIINWIKDDGDIAGKTVCDCGCGVGSLSIPLAKMGAEVSASDISDAMSQEAGRRAKVSVERHMRWIEMGARVCFACYPYRHALLP